MIQCDATWSTEVYDNFKEYKDGKTKSISTGYGIEFGPSINADIGLPGNFKNTWVSCSSNEYRIHKVSNIYMVIF